jgi:hypothetical protein
LYYTALKKYYSFFVQYKRQRKKECFGTAVPTKELFEKSSLDPQKLLYSLAAKAEGAPQEWYTLAV